MALFTLKNLAGQPADPEELRAEEAAARKFGRVSLGEQHIFLHRPLGLGGGYIAYQDLDRWYVRQLEATYEVSSFYSYMFVVEFPCPDSKTGFDEFAVNFEEKKTMDALRTALLESHPELTVGRAPDRKTRVNW